MGFAASMLGGAAISGIGSLMASNAQQDSANKANATLGDYYGQVQHNQQGYTNAGNNAISTMNNNISNGTGFAKAFNMSDFYNDPGYQFTLQQGQNAINNSAAAKGGLLSGEAAKGLASYSSGLANQTYGDAFNRYLQNRQQGYNELAGVAGLGQSATQNLNNAAMSTGAGIANNITGAGNAQAAGYMGMANAGAGALSSIGNYYGAKSLLGKSGSGGLLGGMNSGVLGGARL